MQRFAPGRRVTSDAHYFICTNSWCHVATDASSWQIFIFDIFGGLFSSHIGSLPSGLHIIIRTSRQGHRRRFRSSQGALCHIVVTGSPKNLETSGDISRHRRSKAKAQQGTEIPRAFPHNLKDSKPDSAASCRNDMAKWYDLGKLHGWKQHTSAISSGICKAVISWLKRCSVALTSRDISKINTK